MKADMKVLLAGASFFAFSMPAIAQDAAPDASTGSNAPVSTEGAQSAENAFRVADTIVVQARRREETVQDVPAVVNPVTREQLERLNLRDFTDVSAVVPGLNLANNANGIGGNASIRGVNFDVNASGNNPTVEFYFNDAPITAGAILQSTFDMGQVEVLRGPQGTLKGRASPSGAITLIPQRPDLLEYGGYASATANDIGGYNVNGAVNIPIVEDVLGIRVAGVYEENELNRVKTVNTALGDVDPSSENTGIRVSGLFTPNDMFSLLGTYQRSASDRIFFDAHESGSIADPSVPASDPFISAGDRLSIEETPRDIEQVFNIFNTQATISAAGQQLIYTGGYYTQDILSFEPNDNANFFVGADFGQPSDVGKAESLSHEVRLQNEERVLDRFDYVVGMLHARNDPPTDLTIQTPLSIFGQLIGTNDTDVQRRGPTKETSFFGNATMHVGDNLEIAGGLRFIDFEGVDQLFVGGNAVVDQTREEDATVYSASAKYDFAENLTGYFSYGTSWRPGISAIGDFSLNPSPLELSFLNLDPEESESFELGVKSKWFDNQVSVNASVYRQTFDNYPYRAPGGGVFFVSYDFGGFDPTTGAPIINPAVDQFNFVGAVPATVTGVEADLFYRPSGYLTLGATLAYADGEIENGFIPCNDFDQDGVPDADVTAPSLGELLAVVGTDNLSGCNVSQESAFAAPFQATLFADYDRPVTPQYDGFVRSLFTFDGSSANDPTNRLDDVDAYGIFNLYGGLRDPEGRWEVALFAKNLFDEQQVLTRGANTTFTAYQDLLPPDFMTAQEVVATSDYREITTTAPQEFGINLRYYFGSR